MLDLVHHNNGTRALSTLLRHLANSVIRHDTDSAQLRRASELWQTALDIGVPGEALASTSRFASVSAMDDVQWLQLTARSMQQQPALDDLHQVTIRACRHTDSPEALLIMAAALDVPGERFQTSEVQHLASGLYAATTLKNSGARQVLLTALIESGIVEAALS